MGKYEQIISEPGQYSKWQIWPRNTRVSCCSCDYVHDFQFKVDKDGKIWVRVKVNKRATAAKRRKR